jgi:Arc/MetJ-type ribon-helix-helix transcriptional regulator
MNGTELALLDVLVARGEYPSRAEALRAGLAVIGDQRRRAEIAEAYRRGYETHPQQGDDLGWVEGASAATLSEIE